MFLEKQFNLKLNTSRNKSITMSIITIDAVFSRYLDNLQSKIFVSYFNYHNNNQISKKIK